jgi:hypothetical protein
MWLLHPDPAHRAPSAKAVLNVLGAWEGARDMQLELEELYLECVDSRHSWYTTAVEMAEGAPAPAEERAGAAAEGERAAETGSGEAPADAGADERPAKTTPGRLRSIPRAACEEDEEPTQFVPDRGAPQPGREREQAQPHAAARSFDDATTARWRRPGEDTTEEASP